MFSIPVDTIFFHIIPILSAPLLLLVIVYFVLIKKQFGSEFPFYACFLLSYVIYLMGQLLQFYSWPILAQLIIYTKVSLLFSIGIPSLLLANIKLCGIQVSRFSSCVCYILGLLTSVIFVMVRDGSSLTILFDQKYGHMLPLMMTDATYSDLLIIATSVLVIFPSIYLIVYHLQQKVQTNIVVILCTSLLLGVLFVVGEFSYQYWLFNMSAFFVVGSWYWIVYSDIQSTKQQATKLKERVRWLQEHGAADKAGEVATTQSLDIESLIKNNPSAKNRELIEKAISFIKANFSQEIEITEIAHYTDVSESYLIRVFKKVTGKTINQYITSYRIQQAKRLLRKHSVVETSHAVGFKTPSYFSTVFKKSTGLSPVQYQKKPH